MSVRYQKTQKRVAIATLKALWVEFQAYIREENSVRAAFPSVCLVCLCCVRSERLRSRKYSNEWLVSPISFRWMLLGRGARTNLRTMSSYSVKQLVRAPTTGESSQNLACRMKEQIHAVTARDVCDQHSLFFAPGGMLNLYFCLKYNVTSGAFFFFRAGGGGGDSRRWLLKS